MNAFNGVILLHVDFQSTFLLATVLTKATLKRDTLVLGLSVMIKI